LRNLTLALIGALLAAMVAVPAAAGGSINTDPDRDIERVTPKYNSINYWFVRFGATWCSKVPNQSEAEAFRVGDNYVSPPTRLVINHGQRTVIWFNPTPGLYAAPQPQVGQDSPGWSNAIICGSEFERKVKKPKARIIGPAGDPFFRYVLDNRKSNRPVAFIIQPWGKKVVVPGGCIYRTGWHYEDPYTVLKVKRGNGTVLAKRNSGPGGYYGPLWKGYPKGMTCP